MLREDPDICPVTTLRKYITVTTPCVANLKPQNQYLSHQENHLEEPVQPL